MEENSEQVNRSLSSKLALSNQKVQRMIDNKRSSLRELNLHKLKARDNVRISELQTN